MLHSALLDSSISDCGILHYCANYEFLVWLLSVHVRSLSVLTPPLVDPPTPIGPMAAGYEGGPEDDAIAMSFAPAPPWVSPGVSRALCYATGCVVVGALVASLPALAKRDPEAAAWAVETAAGAREQ
eukprot:SAG22_NODE_4853_length_1150_cov_1.706946_2_plen_126_part_01